MDAVSRVCKEAKRAYEKEGITAGSATVARARLAKAVSQIEDPSRQMEAVEMSWRSLYYEPMSKLRKDKTIDARWTQLAASIFCGELVSLMCAVPSLEAHCSLYIGDLHRYSAGVPSGELSRIHYSRAAHARPGWGQPLNQLGLLAESPHDIRLFLQALLSPIPFASAWDNLSRAINKAECSGLEAELKQILIVSVLNYSRFDLPERCAAWFDELRDAASYDARTVLILHVLTLAFRYLCAHCTDDGYRHLLLSLTDSWLFMISKVKGIDAEEMTTEDVLMMKRRRQRRRRASEEEEEEESDVDNELEHDQESSPSDVPFPVQSPLSPRDRNQSTPFWVLAGCAEWIISVYTIVSRVQNDGRPVARAVTEALDRLVVSLCEKANLFVDKLEEEADSEGAETKWTIDGPREGESDRVTSLRAAALWLFRSAQAEPVPIVFVGHFRLHRESPAQQTEDIGRKMAFLRKEVGGCEDMSWVPVYIVLDTSVFEQKPEAIRELFNWEKQTIVVPAKVLQYLDKNKSKGVNYRTSLRMISLGQRVGGIRVEKSGEDALGTAVSLCPKDYKETNTIVALLTADESQYEDDSGRKGLPLAIHHIDSFRDRWNKELSWRSV